MQKWIGFLGIACSASVAAVVAYLLFEKKVDEEEEIQTTKQSTIKYKVPKDSIGSVIGRGGENIKRIQNESRCRCHFEDMADEKGGRYVVIRGTPEDVFEAQRLIREVIDNEPITVEIKIPVDSVGFVIGRNGDTIRSLCEISRARINVSRTRNEDDEYQNVTIKGSFQQIETAKALIEEKIYESEERTKKIANRIKNRPEFRTSTSSSDNDSTLEKVKSADIPW